MDPERIAAAWRFVKNLVGFLAVVLGTIGMMVGCVTYWFDQTMVWGYHP
jgi:hypothetical protein